MAHIESSGRRALKKGGEKETTSSQGLFSGWSSKERHNWLKRD